MGFIFQTRGCGGEGLGLGLVDATGAADGRFFNFMYHFPLALFFKKKGKEKKKLWELLCWSHEPTMVSGVCFSGCSGSGSSWNGSTVLD